MPRYIITGGPGAGKTTLIEVLNKRGYTCVPEASRELIKQEVLRESDCLPWADVSCYTRLALKRMTEAYDSGTESDLIFYDRGIPDLISYLRLANVPVHPSITAALSSYTYNNVAFILPPWREIYKLDAERWQTFKQSELIYSYLVEVYTKLNFKLITLPKITANQRAGLILNILKRKSS